MSFAALASMKMRQGKSGEGSLATAFQVWPPSLVLYSRGPPDVFSVGPPVQR